MLCKLQRQNKNGMRERDRRQHEQSHGTLVQSPPSHPALSPSKSILTQSKNIFAPFVLDPLRFGVADNNEPPGVEQGAGERGCEEVGGDRYGLGQTPEGEAGGGEDSDASPRREGGGEGPSGSRPGQPLREPLIAGKELSSS